MDLRDGASLSLLDAWLDADAAARAYDELRRATPWQSQSVLIFGKRVAQPRLTAWYGDPGATYTYSGLENRPLPWTDLLSQLRRDVEAAAEHEFNSVLLNFYRDGHDAMGMHSDDERELGVNPVIASLSLGATRRFVVQHRHDKSDRHTFELAAGSLLVMRGTMQHHYKHGLPRMAHAGGRINLTFRHVQ